MKSPSCGVGACGSRSLPVRGAWVEITICARRKARKSRSLPVRGAWVEIAATVQRSSSGVRRSPCGERGLKLSVARWRSGTPPSLPVRGAWVEISQLWCRGLWLPSLPVRGAWVEMAPVAVRWLRAVSRSPCGERGLKSWRREPAPLSPRRSPCGERGLKSPFCRACPA